MITALLVHMKQYSMIIAAVTILLSGCQDKTGSTVGDTLKVNTKHVALKYINGENATNVLNQLFSDGVQDIEVTASGNTSIIIRTNNETKLEKALAVIQDIDLPSSGPPTKFVPLNSLNPDSTAIYLKEQIPDETFQAVADTRTNRIFLMGNQHNLDHATAILHKMQAE